MAEYHSKNTKKITISSILIVMIFTFTIFSYVTAIYAFDSPFSGLRWNSNAYLPETVFSPGDTVQIFGSIEEAERYFYFGEYFSFSTTPNIRWIVTVKGPNEEPLFLESDLLSSFSGNLDFDVVNFVLPSNSAPGTYTVKVFVWTDWLPAGETRTYIISEKDFEVVV